ncbi:phosphotransferase family protein [Halosimplex amylolyticum]|uniref:phosphotransferase family protein n=1 Tax=Halosimplex amylolyticum TaxID=3396616 RepID=UPI003F54E7AD
MELEADSVVPYLREAGVVPADATATAEPLGGGVSNAVLRVEWDGDAVVVKQPFPDLAVEADWPADVERVHNEAAAARVYATVAETSAVSGVRVPEVRYEDDDNHVIVVTAAPERARMWKADLLAGRVDTAIAATLGSVLAAVHGTASGDPAIEREFERYAPFEQLRLDPYHRTVAERYPEYAPAIDREIERLRNTRTTLVHGDFSPKNVLVDDAGEEQTLWLLDFEVAHWGDPLFDVAFMLSHLFIKSVYRAEDGEPYVRAATSFLDAYREERGLSTDRERHLVTELGVLLLARVDGKSPVEYVEREATKAHIRTLAGRILSGETETVEAFVSARRAELDEP